MAIYRLGDSIAASNANNYRQKELKHISEDELSPPPAKRPSWSMSDDKENIPSKRQWSSSDYNKLPLSSDLDFSVQSLIDKMQTGMEVSCVL